MMPYAARTAVNVAKSRSEIEALLMKRKATRIGVMIESKAAIVMFDLHDCRLRFTIEFPDSEKPKDEQARRTKWRALLLCIKAKLETVDSGIETFEEAFLAHVVVGGDGPTVYERIRPQLPQISSGVKTPRLSPPEEK